jgi:hypothetical protein
MNIGVSAMDEATSGVLLKQKHVCITLRRSLDNVDCLFRWLLPRIYFRKTCRRAEFLLFIQAVEQDRDLVVVRDCYADLPQGEVLGINSVERVRVLCLDEVLEFSDCSCR